MRLSCCAQHYLNNKTSHRYHCFYHYLYNGKNNNKNVEISVCWENRRYIKAPNNNTLLVYLQSLLQPSALIIRKRGSRGTRQHNTFPPQHSSEHSTSPKSRLRNELSEPACTPRAPASTEDGEAHTTRLCWAGEQHQGNHSCSKTQLQLSSTCSSSTCRPVSSGFSHTAP